MPIIAEMKQATITVTDNDSQDAAHLLVVLQDTAVAANHVELLLDDEGAYALAHDLLSNLRPRWACCECGSTDVTITVTLNPNTDEVWDNANDQNWCDACQKEIGRFLDLTTEEERAEAQAQATRTEAERAGAAEEA